MTDNPTQVRSNWLAAFRSFGSDCIATAFLAPFQGAVFCSRQQG
jgi:hypothetical protein